MLVIQKECHSQRAIFMVGAYNWVINSTACLSYKRNVILRMGDCLNPSRYNHELRATSLPYGRRCCQTYERKKVFFKWLATYMCNFTSVPWAGDFEPCVKSSCLYLQCNELVMTNEAQHVYVNWPWLLLVAGNLDSFVWTLVVGKNQLHMGYVWAHLFH